MVKHIMVSGLSTTQLEVTWSLPEYGCDAVGFQIYYVKENSSDDKERSEIQTKRSRLSMNLYL